MDCCSAPNLVTLVLGDSHYTIEDMNFLQRKFKEIPHCAVCPYRNGDEWKHLVGNRDYLCIAFQPNDPLRQILVDLTWDYVLEGEQDRSAELPQISRAMLCTPGHLEEARDLRYCKVLDYNYD